MASRLYWINSNSNGCGGAGTALR